MLPRVNKTVRAKIPLTNGYMWVIISHNVPCTDRWSNNLHILCWLYKQLEFTDNDRVHKLHFTNYSKFKKFKDTMKKQ